MTAPSLSRPARAASAPPSAARPTPARPRPPRELLRTGDLQLLTWLAEQYAASGDQLQPLLGCGSRTVQRTLARLRAHGLIETSRLLADQPLWITPTARGLRACGSGFGTWRPRVGLLAHVAAVNEVRLHVQGRDPDAEWVSERQLAKQRQDAREHLPDGVVITGGRSVAVEVELTLKSRRRVEAILDQLTAHYEATVYFCAAGPQRLLDELAASARWPTLGVRALLTSSKVPS